VEFSRLPARIAIYRAGVAQLLGNVTDTVNYAQQALDLAQEDDLLGRGAATAFLGLAYWTSGELEAASRVYAEGMARVRLAGNISDVITSTIARADIRIAQGRLAEAMLLYEQALQAATTPGEPIRQGTTELYVGMSELQCEQNDVETALQTLLKSKELSERTGLPQDNYRWCIALARIRRTQGNLAEALDLLQEAERLYRRDFFPTTRPVGALKARLWLAQGRLGEALGWVREQGYSAADDLSYLREFEHITLARVLITQYRQSGDEATISDALHLLERLLHAAQAGGRMGSAIEILIAQALAHQAQGDMRAALTPLQQALTLAEPEGYCRIFVDEGAPMMHLLSQASAQGIRAAYVASLLAAFGEEPMGHAGEAPHPAAITPPQSIQRTQSAIEPLSDRELDVLRLFATELSGPEIADELVIALSTLRTHTKSIYGKLNVNSRRAAVNRAEELSLL
jgi:LuxR family maltose regulon positive regulatory protein